MWQLTINGEVIKQRATRPTRCVVYGGVSIPPNNAAWQEVEDPIPPTPEEKEAARQANKPLPLTAAENAYIARKAEYGLPANAETSDVVAALLSEPSSPKRDENMAIAIAVLNQALGNPLGDAINHTDI